MNKIKQVVSNRFQHNGNEAKNNEEYMNGLNSGINVFKFNQKGLKKMTMNPKSGPIEFPVEYKGYTDNVQTDFGIANPGDEFEVNGDTVVENMDLSKLSFKKAFDYANNSNLPTFKWKDNEYLIKKNMKY